MNRIPLANYEDIQIGDFAEVVHEITENDIVYFGELSGDYNPLHFNEEYAKSTIFKGCIRHRLLTAVYISPAIGMKLPGLGNIYLRQNMKFLYPARIGDIITARFEVISKDDTKHHITLKTSCINQKGKVVLEGTALDTVMKMD